MRVEFVRIELLLGGSEGEGEGVADKVVVVVGDGRSWSMDIVLDVTVVTGLLLCRMDANRIGCRTSSAAWHLRQFVLPSMAMLTAMSMEEILIVFV